ncbi:MAG TPA: MBL fold metallo-hydrolase [Candidatus Didemnitutus sp.]|jgi:glyoxylase-like metal-dependent hydrolase (beta-lactamase superfamily II)
MNRRDFLFRAGAAAMGLAARPSLLGQTAPAATTHGNPPPVTEFHTLRRNTGYFTGRGGTIGWMVNPDAIVTVDTQFPDTALICLTDLPGRKGRKIDAVINTHHHFDHTSGNRVFRPEAHMLVAQKNVPELQSAAFERSPSSEPPVFPDTLFPEVWRKDVGDEVVSAQYFGPAHTKGDIVVYFERANVLHVGDLVFNRIYPVVDHPGGASVLHWIKVLDDVAQSYPKDAQLICGHGKPGFGVSLTMKDLALQKDFFVALVAHVEAAIKEGRTKDEIVRLANLPGFPDHAADEKTSRLPGNLGAAYDELTSASS